MTTVTREAALQGTRTLPDAWRLEVFRKADIDDPEGARAVRSMAELGVRTIASARVGRGYLLSPELDEATVRDVARRLLVDPVLEDLRVTPPRTAPSANPAAGDVHRVLVMRRPGVMDPVAMSIEHTLERTGTRTRVLTFHAWEFGGTPSAEDLHTLATRLLANEVIEEVLIDSEELHFEVPEATAARANETVALVEADDARLEQVSSEGCLSLTLEEMRAIQAHYRELDREPTACELETLAQTWSEHCKHKTFCGIIELDGERIDNLLKTTIKAATIELDRPWCISVFHDNAGIVAFDDDWHLAFKVETHNHPSAIDPYGGAGTGIGGVIRDILGVGLGAKPIANTNAFFVGPLDLAAEDVPKGCMHPRRILRGVVGGVRDYGNRMGIPTVSGGVWVHPDYVGNPLVYAGTVGLMPADCVEKSVAPGDAIVVAGGRTGRDGIHGATFSSVELHDESVTVSSSAVQIGDPITEKRVLDALLVARDQKLYRGVTDCGAGGLSSAVGEMGERCGAEVHLDRVPLKYPGLSPAEIWISEAQERMVFSVPQEDLEELLAVFEAEDCEATVIGEFTDTGRLVLQYAGEVVGDMDMKFVHDGTPRPVRQATFTPAEHPDPGCPPCDDATDVLLGLLCAPDIASKEWIVRQYDHEVQGSSVLKPLVGVQSDGPGDAAVLQPLADSRRGVAIACGANPGYGLLDPWAMASAAIDEALRNAVCVGGDPDHTAILDNFSWGNCAKPEQLGALVQAARACYATAVAYGTPFISGKDSLNNEFRVEDRTIAIPPTLLISAIAPVPDVARATSMDLKSAGNRVYLIGMTHGELGGSHYLAHFDLAGGRVPRPDLALAPRHLRALFAASSAGLVRSAHDLSEGGLAVAAAEMAFAGGLGLELALASMPVSKLPAGYDPTATLLFSESCTRMLVEVAPEDAEEFEGHFPKLDCAHVGDVADHTRLVVGGLDGKPVIDVELEQLRAAHQGGFQG